jgi:uncharacterized protein (DUF488 family)
VEIYTIGFTKKSAEEFFESLKAKGIKLLIDVRLNNVSQLAGFSKRDDIEYFLKKICRAKYLHMPLLAPTEEILDAYRDKKIAWEEYETRFLRLMEERAVEKEIRKSLFNKPAVLLCSEPEPEQCHRRLVAEYFKQKWGNIKITHL